MEAVEHMELKWQYCGFFDGTFKLKPKVGTFRVKYPICEFELNTQIQTSVDISKFQVLGSHM
jgi:hypothetical protein